MSNNTTHILGNTYDLNDEAGRAKLMDLIDRARDRSQPGNLSAICYALLLQIPCRTTKGDES